MIRDIPNTSMSKARETAGLQTLQESGGKYSDFGDLELSQYAEVFLEALEDEAEVLTPESKAVLDSEVNEKGDQFLLKYSCGSKIFMGRDETAKRSGLFAVIFSDEWYDPVGTESVGNVLRMLKPVSVRIAESDGLDVRRQGEWWFVESQDCSPVFTLSGGLGSKPYNGSPMGSHVAREYGFGVEKEVIRENLVDKVDDGARLSVGGLLDEFSHVWYDSDRLMEMFEPFFVRGTVRHRRNEHSMLSLGDGWYRALTHSVDVVQPRGNTFDGKSVRLDTTRGSD